MMWMYAARGHPARDGLEAYAAYHAQVIADCKAGGMVFQYVGTCNEPNGSNPYLYWPTMRRSWSRIFARNWTNGGFRM